MLSRSGLHLIDLRLGKVGEIIGTTEDREFIIKSINWRFIFCDLFAEENLFFKDVEYKETEKKAGNFSLDG